MLLKTIRKLESTREIRKYHGIRIYLIGFIGRVKIPFSMDFGVGDVVIPSPVERTLPVILPEFEKPMIFTYSLESTVAETIISRLADDLIILRRWDNFCKKILQFNLSFTNVVKLIIDFLQPPYEALIHEEELFKNWNHERKEYE